ncbi:MAG: DUF6691 family protein [Vibrio sp.]
MTGVSMNIKQIGIVLLSGALFGAGMVLSGMVRPDKVLGFLDLSGQWDPSLAFVMGGGLITFMSGYHLWIKPKSKPVLTENFNTPNHSKIDKQLVLGAALFGVGWGLAGICPGPAMASLSSAHLGLVVFIAMMALGQFIAAQLKKCFEL